MMPHVSAKHLLGLLLLLGLSIDILLRRRPCHTPGDSAHSGGGSTDSSPPSDLTDVACYLNRRVSSNVGLRPDSRRVECRAEGDTVYLPFDFIQREYELRGEMVDGQFELSTSYSKVFVPKGRHEAKGPFMHFGNFKVELRSRVLCVSASTGVPLSTQWDPAGYYYPTQIAQYALAHHSNHLSAGPPARTVLDDGKDVLLDLGDKQARRVGDKQARRVTDKKSGLSVIEFEDTDGLVIEVSSSLAVVCLEVLSLGSVVVTIELEVGPEGERVDLVYSTREPGHIRPVGEEGAVFGLGPATAWTTLTRDVGADLERARALRDRAGGRDRRSVLVSRVRVSGQGRVRRVWLSDQEHRRLFLQAADWFLDTQDSSGGWPSLVIFNRRRAKYPAAGEVPPGWYGAMCQGQAISVLVRAHLSTPHDSGRAYLAAAVRAVGIFNLSLAEGGVRGEVLGLPWYQEYPTHPPSHILNGFIYGLLGLQELGSVQGAGEAELLYRQGMESLLTLLPLFDSGSGTFYDLRHLTMHTEPKIARWDYHATHVNQLLTLATVSSGRAAALLKGTAGRWRGYMLGRRAGHN